MTAYHHHAAIRALIRMSGASSGALRLTHARWACGATRASLEKWEMDSKAEVDGS